MQMTSSHIPIAARLEGVRRQRASLGFNAIIHGSRPGSATSAARSPMKAIYALPDESNLGYDGVIERADSVDFGAIDFDDLRNGGSPSQHGKAVAGAAVEPTISPAIIGVQKTRVERARPASADARRGQIAKGLTLTHKSLARPSGSGPAVGGPPFGPPLGPAQGGRGGSGEFFTFEGSPDQTSGGNSEWTRGSEPVHDNSRSPLRPEAPARSRVVGSLEDVLKAKESELSHLNSLLVQQAEEKRKIEHHRFQLAAENLNLRGQVAELQTRQRPWSASSAGSRSHLYQGQHQQQSHIHTIHEHKPQYLLQPQPGGAQRPPRPMSASQHQSAHPRDIPGQDLVRRSPVFGQESLLHRSTYAPTQSLAPIPDATDSGPQKDFVRPEAFRMLNGVMQLEGPARPASRMRPQSANAAVRQVTLRPASGAPRPGSARPRSSYAERLMHADADEIARFHVRLPTEDVTKRVINILAFMRSAAEKKFIRVGDFMVSFDKLKRGHISCTEFRRALESCGCFGDLSEEEYNLVFSFFLHESTATANVLSPMSRISYPAFCEVLQPIGDKRVKLNVDQQVLREIGQKKGQAAQDSALSTNELSAEGETKLKTLVERILAAIKTNRISARDFLERLDPRSAHGKGSRVSPNVNVSTGSMSRSQYLRGIQNCNIGMSFSDDDLALLFCKYDRNGEFNYLRFCRDMEAAERR